MNKKQKEEQLYNMKVTEPEAKEIISLRMDNAIRELKGTGIILLIFLPVAGVVLGWEYENDWLRAGVALLTMVPGIVVLLFCLRNNKREIQRQFDEMFRHDGER